MKATKTRVWKVIVVLFVLANVGGAVFAIALAQPLHAILHVALSFGAYLGWRRITQGKTEGPAPTDNLKPGTNEPLGTGIEYLQQSVDAIAIEVERIGEAQRFNEKLRAERGEKPAPPDEQA